MSSRRDSEFIPRGAGSHARDGKGQTQPSRKAVAGGQGSVGDTAFKHAAHAGDGEDFAFAPSMKDQVLIRKRRKTHAKLKRRLKIAGIAVAAVAVLVGGAAFAVHSIIKQGEASFREASALTEVETPDTAQTQDNGRTVEYNGHTYAYNESVVSIVVMGNDKTLHTENSGAGQADAVMVLALDTQTGKMTMIGIPRDSMVEVDEFAGDAFVGQDVMQLCLAFSYGDGAHTSCEYTTNAVSRILYNMPMKYYMALDYDGIGPLADALGGIALTPLQTVPNTAIVEGQDTVLYGDSAAAYVQWRDIADDDSAMKRQARQVQFMKAFFAKAVSSAKGDVGALIDLYNIAGEYSCTNLGLNEFSYLATALVQGGASSLETTTLEGTTTIGSQYAETYLDKESVYQTVLDVYYTQVD